MQRLPQVVLIASFLPLCWLGMMAVHEFGHVIGAWMTGGTVTRVVLHPLSISRTEVEPNPVWVVWSGPVIGVTLPLLMWLCAQLSRVKIAYLFRFFSGFCFVANGTYIGFGSFSRIGDAGTMLQHGSPAWTLWLFGAVTVPIGFLLWNGLGQHFGFGAAQGKVDERTAYAVLVMLVVTAALAATISPRG